MGLFSFDTLMIAATAAGQAILLFVLFKWKLYKAFPIFTGWIAFLLLADQFTLLVMYLLHVPFSEMAANPVYFRLSSATRIPEYLFEIGVLFELGRNVLVPVKSSLPRMAIVIFAVLVLLGGLVTFFLAGQGESGTMLSRAGSVFVKIILASAVLRIVCFLVIAVFAQMLGVGWKNHVLQLATGLAFYGAVDLVVQLVRSHLALGASLGTYYTQYRLLDELRVIGYLSTLTFWCWSFSRPEAPRREFSPQMAGFLVSISGAAKRNRSHFGR